MNPPPDWTPADQRAELHRLRKLMAENKCPRDRVTIETTILGLEERQSLINDKVRESGAGIPQFWVGLTTASTTLLLPTALAALGQSGWRVVVFWSAFVIEAVALATSLTHVYASNQRLKRQQNEADTVSEYTATIAALRARIDDSREYEKGVDDVYIGLLGSKDEIAELHNIRDAVNMLASCSGGERDTTFAAIEDRLIDFRGNRMSDRFRRLLAIIDRAMDSWRESMAPQTEPPDSAQVRVTVGADASSPHGVPEEALRTADPKRKEEGN